MEQETETAIEVMPEEPQVPEERKRLVSHWCDRVRKAKDHFGKRFKAMRDDAKFLRGDQWDGDTGRYVANIVQRHVQQRVAALYAKNPVIKCKRRDTMDFTLWDGKLETAAAAFQAMQAMQQPQVDPVTGAPMMPQIDPNAMALMQDIQSGMERRKQLDKVSKTMEVVTKYTLAEQLPPFKMSMKQLVRRTCSVGVGYVKIGIQRAFAKRPEDVEKVTDITQQLETLARLIEEAGDGEIEQHEKEAEQLRLLLAEIQAKPEVVTKEGVVFDFPKSDDVIVDPKCNYLRGFSGAGWIAHQFKLSVDDVKEIYGVELKDGKYTAYTDGIKKDGEKSCDKVLVWEVYSKNDGQVFTIADGHDDFLREPAEPEVKLERFWPIFVLAFNEVESTDDEIYPPSDVELLRPAQKEYNRARDGLREHRFANRPATATSKGMLSDEDKMKLETHPANAVIELNALQPNQKIDDVLQPIKNPPIDPALYEVDSVFIDVQRIGGSQEANLGGTSGSSATESSIAESSRMSSLQSNIDDLDDMMNEIARSLGQVLLRELSVETVKRIAGPGAVWPELSAQDIEDELILEVEAGSSGRPNKAAELANWERMMPFLLQLPGVNPQWLAKQAVMRLDDRLDITDAIIDGLPSITQMNAQKQVGTGDPATDPNAQGDKGANNQEQPQQSEGAPQGMNPAEAPVLYDAAGNRIG